VLCGGRGSGAGTDGPNVVTGSVMGHGFSQVSSAYWIGNPATDSDPVIFFLSEAPLDCATISEPEWDKHIGAECQLLEVSVSEELVQVFAVPDEASESYLRDNYNPDAESGMVTVTALNAGQNIVGSFDGVYPTGSLTGRFDAEYCGTGVEP